MADPRYRVGRRLGRTVYRTTPNGDELIGVMDTPELGALVVDALNAATADLPPPVRTGHALTNRGPQALQAMLRADPAGVQKSLRLLTRTELVTLAAGADLLANTARELIRNIWPAAVPPTPPVDTSPIEVTNG